MTLGMPLLLHTLLRLENILYEYRFGISTRGVHGFTPGDWSKKEHTYYATIPYRAVFRILDSLALGRSDVIVDLGCGKGRVLCCALLYDVARVMGVEDTKELAGIARHNLNRMGANPERSTVVSGGAEDFDYSQGTVFYMLHPFGPRTLETVLSCIHSCVSLIPRQVRIVYVNPKHDSVLEAAGWLERYQRWSPGGCVRYPVSFWSSRFTTGGR